MLARRDGGGYPGGRSERRLNSRAASKLRLNCGVKVLRLAGAHGKRVRVVGAGNSPSDVACCDDGDRLMALGVTGVSEAYVCDWAGLDGSGISDSDGSVAVQIDRDARAVEVEAGCRLRDLHDLLRSENDRAFSSLGSISDQTVAGAVLTGTHGTGLDYGLLAESIRNLRIHHQPAHFMTFDCEGHSYAAIAGGRARGGGVR